jgi:outer membrane protein assembly factor BamA
MSLSTPEKKTGNVFLRVMCLRYDEQGDSRMNKLAAFFMSFLLASTAYAQNTQTENTSGGSYGAAPFPIVAYFPETSLMLGVGSVFYHEPETGTKIDSLKILAYYTLKKQYEVHTEARIYLANDRFLFTADNSASKYPDEYYGVGPDTPSSSKEHYTPIIIPASGSFLVKIISEIYLGPTYEYRYNHILSSDNDGAIEKGIPGSGRTISSGAGGTLECDLRSGGLNPSSGFYAKISALRFSKQYGSDHTFTTVESDFRGYIPLFYGTIGLQAVCEAAQGDIPFYYYPTLGKDTILRGYLRGRYIEHRMAAMQAEYRFPLYNRVGGTLFGGAGEVAENFKQFGKHPRAAGGVGLRFMIDTKQKINIRADIAYNGNEVLAYVNIMEAF